MTRTRLTRNLTERVLGGVCSGLGATLAIDAWWVRAVFALLTIAIPGFGILLYVLLWLTVPAQGLSDLPPVSANSDEAERPARAESVLLVGFGSILAGVVVLAYSANLLKGAQDELLTPALLLLIGLALLARQFRRS